MWALTHVYSVEGANVEGVYAASEYGIRGVDDQFARREDAEAVVHALAARLPDSWTKTSEPTHSGRMYEHTTYPGRFMGVKAAAVQQQAAFGSPATYTTLAPLVAASRAAFMLARAARAAEADAHAALDVELAAFVQGESEDLVGMRALRDAHLTTVAEKHRTRAAAAEAMKALRLHHVDVASAIARPRMAALWEQYGGGALPPHALLDFETWDAVERHWSWDYKDPHIADEAHLVFHDGAVAVIMVSTYEDGEVKHAVYLASPSDAHAFATEIAEADSAAVLGSRVSAGDESDESESESDDE